MLKRLITRPREGIADHHRRVPNRGDLPRRAPRGARRRVARPVEGPPHLATRDGLVVIWRDRDTLLLTTPPCYALDDSCIIKTIGGELRRPKLIASSSRPPPTGRSRVDGGGRPASGLVTLALAFLRSRLDPRHPGRRGEEGRVTVVPTDSEAWRLFLEHLFDHAPAPGLSDPLRLDDDQVSRVCRHAQPHLLQQLEARL